MKRCATTWQAVAKRWLVACQGHGRQRLKQLIVKRHQVGPLHGTAPRDAVTVNRFDHDSLATRLAEHLGNAIAVSHECSAGGSTANAGSGAFRRHRARRVFATRMIMPIAGACVPPTGRGIRRIFQILGFCYAPNRCASLTRSWPRRVRFNQHPIQGVTCRIQRCSDILACREAALSTQQRRGRAHVFLWAG